MSYKTVIRLAKKFAAHALNTKYQAQRDMLEDFNNNFLSDFSAILNKMESDLFVLKEQKLNKFTWKELGNFWKDLVKIYKDYNKNKSYTDAQYLINFIEKKMPWIKEIQLSIQDHLENSPVSFTPMSDFQSAQIDSLEDIIDLTENLKQHMMQNPLIQESLIPSFYPTGLQPIVDDDFIPAPSQAVTKIDVSPK